MSRIRRSTAYPLSDFSSLRAAFAVIGDYGLAGPNEASVAALAPDFMLTLGDNNYFNGRLVDELALSVADQ